MHFEKAFAPFIYEGIVKQLIKDFKSCRNIYLARTLVALTLEALGPELFPGRAEVITSVPAHWTAEVGRLMNPMDILGREFARAIKLPYKNLLAKTRLTRHQRALKKRERLGNLDRAFGARVRRTASWRRVLLIDDVFTTGTTVNECAKILKSSGFTDVFVLTIARGH